MVVDDFYEAATDVEDTGSISAASNEGAAEHAIGDATFLWFFLLPVGSPFCHACLYSTPQKYSQACLLFFVLLAYIRWGVWQEAMVLV